MTDAELRQLFELWYLEQGQTDALSPVPLLWIGAQEPSWVWQEDAAGRFMLSGARAMERHGDRPWPRATVPVMWDSGAYIHLKKHGRWTWPAHDYAAYTARACRGLGRIEHAAPQDWMCETDILLKTHVHELRTGSKAEADAPVDPALLKVWRRMVLQLDPFAHPEAVACLDPEWQAFVAWKAQHSRRSSANSKVFAEDWRRRQQGRLVDAGILRMHRLNARSP